MNRFEFVKWLLLLALAIACIFYFFSSINKLPPMIAYYLLFLPALFCCVICIVNMIWGTIRNKQMKKYVPRPLTKNVAYYTLRYTSVDDLQNKFLLDGFVKYDVLVDGQTISRFYRSSKQQSKFNYTWLNDENIFLVKATENLNVKKLMQAIEKQNEGSDINAKHELAHMQSSILCIIGESFSNNEILNLIKHVNYIHQPIYLTIALDKKAARIYRASVPSKQRTLMLYKIVKAYFS